MILQSLRLSIRRFESNDAIALLNAMECPQIAMMYSNELTTISKVQQYIDVLKKEYASGLFRTLAIADKNINTVIGSITLDTDKVFPRAEISYWVDIEHRNIGYATEAVKAMIEYGFQRLNLNRIQAMHFTSNPASGRVLEKSGMLYEGTLREYVGMGETSFDCKMYAILKSDVVNHTK